jgi:hypothetical protein
MKRYKNLAGDSGVSGYDIKLGSIAVQFDSGDTYLYTDQSAGKDNVITMQNLAMAGEGLSTFIAQSRPVYSNKWRG